MKKSIILLTILIFSLAPVSAFAENWEFFDEITYRATIGQDDVLVKHDWFDMGLEIGTRDLENVSDELYAGVRVETKLPTLFDFSSEE